MLATNEALQFTILDELGKEENSSVTELEDRDDLDDLEGSSRPRVFHFRQDWGF